MRFWLLIAAIATFASCSSVHRRLALEAQIKEAYEFGFRAGTEKAENSCWSATQDLAISQYDTLNELNSCKELLEEFEK